MTGTLATTFGGAEDTGRSVRIDQAVITHLRDGKIIEAWEIADIAALGAQVDDGSYDDAVDTRGEPMATTSARSGLTREGGRAVATARGLHAVVDSPPPLGGPNEAMNPLDLLLAALATCGTFVCETAAQELSYDLTDAVVDVEADFDPQGVKGVEDVSPAIQVFRVTLTLHGVDDAQAEELAGHFQRRCPVFTTLEKAAPIELTVQTA